MSCKLNRKNYGWAKRKRISVFEKILTKTATVVQVRTWDFGNICEAVIHLPNVDFSKWNKTPAIKCRTSAMHFTDYTPSIWDNQEHICTLYIDISHSGQGINWAKVIKEKDILHYLHIDFENHYLIDGKQLIFLGDQTAIGHFCALQQLASPNAKIGGYICLNDQPTAKGFTENCPWLPLETLTSYEEINQKTEQLIQELDDKENCIFYIVGYAKMVVLLRKHLKSQSIAGEQIKSKGFWH